MIVEIVTLACAGGIRSIAGFVENIFKKGETKFEIGKFFGTAVKIAVLGLGIHYGFGVGTMQATGLAVASDFGLSALKDKLKKK